MPVRRRFLAAAALLLAAGSASLPARAQESDTTTTAAEATTVPVTAPPVGDTGVTVPATEAPRPTATTSPPPPPATFAIEVEVPKPQLPSRDAEWPVRQMVFPVLGPVTYYDDWGACRGGAGCPRLHVGNDIIGVRLQPLIATRDGWVTRIIDEHVTAGNGITLTDDEGWQYRYYHVNNDDPGSNDGSDPVDWKYPKGVALGTRVTAGQIIAYMGNSGNAEYSVPHVHFEIATPDNTRIDPFKSLRAAQDAARCLRLPGLGELPDYVPPFDSDAQVIDVPTITGKGVFTYSSNGGTFYTGDARSVGWSRYDEGAVPCASGPRQAIPKGP